MVDFIELANANRSGDTPVLIRKSQVVAFQPISSLNSEACFVYMQSGDMFHVKQSYNELKEQFKFE